MKTELHRSFRITLIGWFLLLSVGPVLALTVFFILEFRDGVGHEVHNRLMANIRVLDVSLQELSDIMEDSGKRMADDPGVTYALASSDLSSLKTTAMELIKASVGSTLSIYDSGGTPLVLLRRSSTQSKPTELYPSEALEEEVQKALDSQETVWSIQAPGERAAILRQTRKILSVKGSLLGYLDQYVNLNTDFLAKIRAKHKLEYILMGPYGTVTNSTLILPSMEKLLANVIEAKESFEFSSEGVAYQFLTHKLWWGMESAQLYLGLDVVDFDQSMARLLNSLIVLLPFTFIFFGFLIAAVTRKVNRPIEHLVAATQRLSITDHHTDIIVESDDEFGWLSRSFNDMGHKLNRNRLELRTKIRELEMANKAIKDTQDKLVQSAKMASLGQLVAGVAHELNNPIGFIHSNLLQLKEYAEKLAEFAKRIKSKGDQFQKDFDDLDVEYIHIDMPKLIGSCIDGSKRTRDIVIGLRNFSRADTEQVFEIDINRNLDLTLDIIKGELKGRIDVKRTYGEIPKIKGHTTQINQVFLNILSNAAQAILKEGSVWIKTKSFFKDKSQWIEVSIQDSGPGMNEATIEKIFDPFFTTKPVGQGTGLGLSISYGIVARHSGELLVKSRIGVGTEFRILLPVEYTPAQKNVD